MSAAASEAGAAARARLAGFVRTLRMNGYPVGLAESRDALAILAQADLSRPGRIMPALRALFATRREEFERFEEVFRGYWLARPTGVRVASAGATRGRGLDLRALAARDGPGEEGTPDRVGPGEDGEGAAAPNGPRRAGGSARERLEATDFRHLSDPAELEAAHRLAERLARRMRARLARRARAARRGGPLDLRRTLARAVARGGEPLDLLRARPREKPPRLVVLLDASGSMSVYATTFVRFVHGVLGAFRAADAYLFHTRLVPCADALRERDPVRAAERFALLAQGVGGGTRIGESLRAFNRVHARRALGARSIAVVVSDGYDAGDPELLGREMARLARRAGKVVWLNPMAGWRGYEPAARGMRAALPHVDLFAAANTLERLAALEDALTRLR